MGKVDNYYNKVRSISFGEVLLENTIVSFTNNSMSTVGTEFFKNYDLIINWFTKEILLSKITEYDNTTLTNLGFSYCSQDNRLMVRNMHENMTDLKLGDRILEINKIRYDNLLLEHWFEIDEGGLFDEKVKEISMVILRDSKEFKYKFKKTNLL